MNFIIIKNEIKLYVTKIMIEKSINQKNIFNQFYPN